MVNKHTRAVINTDNQAYERLVAERNRDKRFRDLESKVARLEALVEQLMQKMDDVKTDH